MHGMQARERGFTGGRKGVTVRKTTDVIIATFCIENHMPLLFSDRDFLPFVDKLGLVAVVIET